MRIRIIGKEEKATEFQSLQPGTVFAFMRRSSRNRKHLRLQNQEYLVLTWGGDEDAFVIGSRFPTLLTEPVEVLGHLTGIEVTPNE